MTILSETKIIRKWKRSNSWFILPGFYLYSYNEELPTNTIDTYTMKVEIQKEGLDCNTEIYLYYIGD